MYEESNISMLPISIFCAPRRCGSNLKLQSPNTCYRLISWAVPVKLLQLHLGDKSILGQVVALLWWHQATSRHLSQCWRRPLLPYGGTRPQSETYRVSANPTLTAEVLYWICTVRCTIEVHGACSYISYVYIIIIINFWRQCHDCWMKFGILCFSVEKRSQGKLVNIRSLKMYMLLLPKLYIAVSNIARQAIQSIGDQFCWLPCTARRWQR